MNISVNIIDHSKTEAEKIHLEKVKKECINKVRHCVKLYMYTCKPGRVCGGGGTWIYMDEKLYLINYYGYWDYGIFFEYTVHEDGCDKIIYEGVEDILEYKEDETF